MKKSKIVGLVLITSALASCHKEEPIQNQNPQKVYLRSDSTAPYSKAHYQSGVGHHGGAALLWWYAFRPYGNFGSNGYNHAGYYSNGISENANLGRNSIKSSYGSNPSSSSSSRGGFGKSSFHVSS